MVHELRETSLSVEEPYLWECPSTIRYFVRFVLLFFVLNVESLLCARQWANVLVQASLNAGPGVSLKSAQKEQGWRWRDLSSREGQEAKGSWASWAAGPIKSQTRVTPPCLPWWLCLLILSSGFLCLLVILLSFKVVLRIFHTRLPTAD